MSTITITRALTELKTLDKRIQKEIDGGVFVNNPTMCAYSEARKLKFDNFSVS